VPLVVGTSGWHYADWWGTVYPRDLAKTKWLSCLARDLPTVELNNSFYRLPDRTAFETWAEQVPPGFLFAVKVSRYLTHVRRLRDPAEPVTHLLRETDGLGAACGPFLLPRLRVFQQRPGRVRVPQRHGTTAHRGRARDGIAHPVKSSSGLLGPRIGYCPIWYR
jgi:hypothetical protein